MFWLNQDKDIILEQPNCVRICKVIYMLMFTLWFISLFLIPQGIISRKLWGRVVGVNGIGCF